MLRRRLRLRLATSPTMPKLPDELYYATIAAQAADLAAVVDCTDPALPVPACPGWTLRQLATHVGRAHRWAAEIITTRSEQFIEFESVPDRRLPDDHTARGRWLTAGAARLVTAIRDAGDDRMWTLGSIGPASFWARRMAHETTVHCADAQLAAGDEVSIPAELAADAIDEWLTTMSGPLFGQPDPRADALALGRTLHVHATDPGLGDAGEWLVRHSGDGVQVRSGHAKADVALAGPAQEILLVLLRRRPAASQVSVHGDDSVLSRWLERTRF
jgi:uncharacterized protein (TIGR03083 family)